MVILKKIRAATLNEIIIATVIIVIVFGISLGILVNIMQNMARRDTQLLNKILAENAYAYKNKKLTLPPQTKYLLCQPPRRNSSLIN